MHLCNQIYVQVIEAYIAYMTDVGVLLGGERNSTHDQMAKVVEFETKLANVSSRLVWFNCVMTT